MARLAGAGDSLQSSAKSVAAHDSAQSCTDGHALAIGDAGYDGFRMETGGIQFRRQSGLFD
jgi:hypothetical protein